MLARCRGAFFLFFLPLTLLSTGCRNRTDLVEAELRTKTALYNEALADQHKSEFHIQALQREIEALRQGSKITPEQAAQTFGVKRIALGRATGGCDHDNIPGDELLQVVVEPRDCDDHTIKVPGSLLISALEITPQGLKAPLCTWDIPPEQLRQSWKQGLLSNGYTLMLPWKMFPATENVRVVVRLVTPDERIYEADKDVKVRVVPGAALKRSEMLPEAWPAPVPMPIPTPAAGPVLVPTGKITSSNWSPAPAVPVHRTDWQPVTPAVAAPIVTIGRPRPLDPPAP